MADKIIIDAGHNGLNDPGAVYNGRRESDDVLRLAMAVGEILSRNGYEVAYTRTGDINQSVTQKANFANDADADLMISIHRNMATYPGQYNGVQTLLYDQEGIKQPMAERINQNLEGLGFRNIGIDLRPNLAVLRRTEMPALLLEVGFIDSDTDNQLFDSRFQEIAQAIADGIMDTLSAADDDDSEDDASRYSYRPSYLTNPQATSFSTWTPDPPQSQPTPPLYRVQVGAFHNLQNAIELEQELKLLGYNTWIVTV